MSKKDNDCPTFPTVVPDGFFSAEAGMSLRDWFAGQAINGILSHPATFCEDPAMFDELVGRLSEASYRIADAMIVAQEK